MDGKQTAAPKEKKHRPKNSFSIIFNFNAAICTGGKKEMIQTRSS
jgi:hypothetical protein